ncbi:MAG TPA: RNA polymerase sigma factor [Gaiellaceae bacterium]|nr:RNA polymerase sigma factor [Gaiellaceae bacterium]
MDARTEALERLYRERYVSFRNGIAPVVGSYEEARDVVQEAFVRALRSRKDFRGEGSLQAWVWRIALRVALEKRRRGHDASIDVVDPELVESERDPELAAALRRLPPRKRLVVFLRYFADLSYAEIAEIGGISEGTVAAALNQARAALLEQLSAKEVKR